MSINSSPEDARTHRTVSRSAAIVALGLLLSASGCWIADKHGETVDQCVRSLAEVTLGAARSDTAPADGRLIELRAMQEEVRELRSKADALLAAKKGG
jgi:hypothetical protein